MKSAKPILLVEDDDVDILTVTRSFRDIKVMNRVLVAKDGEEALTLLKSPAHERPCIMLLDLNMPKMTGLELLRIIKQDAQLKRIPVVVLTTSVDEHDKLASFDLGVAGYIIKPVDYQSFMDIVRTIDVYWTLSEMPEE